MECNEIKLKIQWPYHHKFCIIDNISDPCAGMIYAESDIQAILLTTIEVARFFELEKVAKNTQPIIRELKPYFKIDSPDFQTITIKKTEL